MRGITFSADHCAKISASQTGERNHRFGKKQNPEVNKKALQTKRLNGTLNNTNTGKAWYNNSIINRMFIDAPDETWTKGRL